MLKQAVTYTHVGERLHIHKHASIFRACVCVCECVGSHELKAALWMENGEGSISFGGNERKH